MTLFIFTKLDGPNDTWQLHFQK